MRILFVTQWFQPETIFKGLPFALELQRLGHEVEVLTGFPNYPTGKVHAPYRIQPLMIEQMEGIRVVRVPLYPSHDRSVLPRIANYTSFAASAATIGLAAIRRKPDITYVYSPPATAGFPALLNRILQGVPYVIDIQDLWPDTLSATGMFSSKVACWGLTKYCALLYRGSSTVVVLSPGFKRTLVERGVPQEKIRVIYNWADDSAIEPAVRDSGLMEELGLKGRFNVMFAGNMGIAQGLDTVLSAAEMLVTRCPLAQLVFVGGGVDAVRIRDEAARRSLNNVRFISQQPISKMAKLLALADVMLVHLTDTALFRITIPSKIQAYMAAGRPMICAVRGDAASLVTEAKAGVTCEPEQPKSLADAICHMASMDNATRAMMGQNGWEFYVNHLSMRVGALHFVDLFGDILNAKSCDHPRNGSRFGARSAL